MKIKFLYTLCNQTMEIKIEMIEKRESKMEGAMWLASV